MALQGALAAKLAGERLMHGTFVPTAASTAVVTGLESIRTALVSLAAAPVITCMWVHCTWSGATLTVVTTQPTHIDTDITPKASETPWVAVAWIAIGQGAR